MDFTDVDLFALSGPTGAGKSTIIDAICVALYGSVPRYDDLRVIAPIISQGMNQATIRLTFLVEGVEYSATRVIVRTKTGGNTREARLQRGDDVIAGTADEVKARVGDLLGLSFDQFTRCVVLPQGEFAKFLHDKPKERQDLLKRLLGIEIYERIAAAARARGVDAQARRVSVEEQLGALAVFTAERRAELVLRSTALAQLASQIDEHEATIAVLENDAAAAVLQGRAVTASIAQLRDVKIPGDIAQLGRERLDAETAQHSAEAAVIDAEAAANQLRAKLDALGDVGELRAARLVHKQLAVLSPITPELRTRTEANRLQFEALSEELASIELLLIETRRRAEQTEAAATRHSNALDRLRAIGVPSDVDSVSRDAGDVDVALAEATADEANVQQRIGDLELKQVPDVEQLVALKLAFDTIDDLTGRLAALAAAHTTASERQRVALAKHDGAVAAVDMARAHVEAIELADRAGAIRQHLVEGEPCPVCAQNVLTIPKDVDDGDVKGAKAALRSAESFAKAAHAVASEADRAAASLVTQTETLQTALERARGDPNRASRAHLAAQRDALDEHRRLLSTAREEQAGAGARCADLRKKRQQIDVHCQRLTQLLIKAVASVTDLGPPEAMPGGLAEGWRALEGWIDEETTRQRALMVEAERGGAAERATVVELVGSIARRCEEASLIVAKKQTASGTAHGEAQRLAAELKSIDEKVRAATEFRQQLAAFAASHPLASADPEAIEERIAAVVMTQDALTKAEADRRKAATALSTARVRFDNARLSIENAERRFGSVCASLVGLDAPSNDTLSLLERWSALVAWATTELARFEERLAALHVEASTRSAEIDARSQEMVTALSSLDVTTRPNQRPSAAAAAAISVNDMTIADFDEQVQRRNELNLRAAHLGKDEAVAKELGRLLNAANFEKWLLDDVLRQLVDGATDRLMELSGQQYSLTYDTGDFLVVDHRNADQTRSARTLSGGETFLASLALALSLADQLASFSTGRTATLEALFLDEGFGTLDPETLDVVASAIEELGSQGRMIGVVSHVAELAERVPVRYVVTKNGNAATITKVFQ